MLRLEGVVETVKAIVLYCSKWEEMGGSCESSPPAIKFSFPHTWLFDPHQSMISFLHMRTRRSIGFIVKKLMARMVTWSIGLRRTLRPWLNLL